MDVDNNAVLNVGGGNYLPFEKFTTFTTGASPIVRRGEIIGLGNGPFHGVLIAF